MPRKVTRELELREVYVFASKAGSEMGIPWVQAQNTSAVLETEISGAAGAYEMEGEAGVATGPKDEGSLQK